MFTYLFLEMEDNDDKPESEQEDAISYKDQWDLGSRVKQQVELPVLCGLSSHVSYHKEDRFGNNGCPGAHRSLSFVEDGYRELFDEIVGAAHADKCGRRRQTVVRVLPRCTALNDNFSVIEESDDAAHGGRSDLGCQGFVGDHASFDKEVTHVDVVVDSLKLSSDFAIVFELFVSNQKDINRVVLHKIKEDGVLHICIIAQMLGKLFTHKCKVVTAVSEIQPV